MLGTFAVRLDFPISLAERDDSDPIAVPIALPSDGEIAALELTLARFNREWKPKFRFKSAKPTPLFKFRCNSTKPF